MNVTRNVITLDPTLKLDEVDMPYKSFIVLYSGQIIREIIRDKGWTITKANNFLKSKFMYDPYIYSLIQRMLAENEYSLILNRNPRLVGL